ncbi:MAG: 4Fe-4S dicluster domain-containing protein [Elusimicrobia bacterium]|nr:4Fe-4S dicluster domain-containing protein [Candidatus Liberimonas magnetica]
MRYPKLRELKEAIKALIQGPVTTKYPQAPHIPFPAFRGRPVPSSEDCIACGACALVCPARAIEVKENLDKRPATREVIWHYDICIFCKQCERLCTTLTGVHLGQEFDLATTDRSVLFEGIEKELILCEDCGEIIVPKAQLLWMIKKLGPLSSGNFNLIYTAQKELLLAEDLNSGLPSEPHQRTDLYRIICPKCRHQVLVFNQTGKQL